VRKYFNPLNPKNHINRGSDKAHGGEIKVETKVDEGNQDNVAKGEGTTFIIQLPIA